MSKFLQEHPGTVIVIVLILAGLMGFLENPNNCDGNPECEAYYQEEGNYNNDGR